MLFVKDLAPWLGLSTIMFSKNDPENPSHDDILITADKNPNQAYVKTLGLSPFAHLPQETKAVIVQRNLSDKDHAVLKERGLAVIALFATNETALDDVSETIFPLATYTEQAGSFVNEKGLSQSFSKGF